VAHGAGHFPLVHWAIHGLVRCGREPPEGRVRRAGGAGSARRRRGRRLDVLSCRQTVPTTDEEFSVVQDFGRQAMAAAGEGS
ncbi:hypothetical protein AB0M39_35485, partial [Streptomyces sp. NPDC051907]|uniref:hypothetical protein n=1 Tax=Streptomyces sp. NPDC051907 TaxID=3155284 RepID=UPI0034425F85